MMRAVLCVALILASSYAASYDEAFLENLKGTDFGKTILQTVQLELGQNANSDSVNRVVALLRQMRADTQQEQSEANVNFRTSSQSCGAETQAVVARLTGARQQKADDERKLPLLNEEQRDKERQANDKIGQEQRNNDRIHQLTQQRHESRQDYEARRDELTGLAATLSEAKRIIGQLKTGSSFLQVTEPVLAELKKHTAKFQKHYQAQRGFHGLVTLLLETMQDAGIQANQSGVQKIIDVIDELVESIYDLQKQELIAENAREQDFQTQRARLLLENQRLEGTIAHLRAKVQVINQIILELSNDIATNVQIIEQKTKEQRDWEKTCSDSQRFHELATANRNEQLDILRQVIEIFETRFDGVTAFIQGLKFD